LFFAKTKYVISFFAEDFAVVGCVARMYANSLPKKEGFYAWKGSMAHTGSNIGHTRGERRNINRRHASTDLLFSIVKLFNVFLSQSPFVGLFETLLSLRYYFVCCFARFRHQPPLLLFDRPIIIAFPIVLSTFFFLFSAY
jgi:hypothetical protein